MDEAANDNGVRAPAAPPEETPADPPAGASKRRCPICGRVTTAVFRPFCSKRCADVDLHRWLGEGYRVPVEVDEDMRDSPDAE